MTKVHVLGLTLGGTVRGDPVKVGDDLMLCMKKSFLKELLTSFRRISLKSPSITASTCLILLNHMHRVNQR